MPLVAQEALGLADLRSPIFGEQSRLVDRRQTHRDDERQAEAVEQVNVELLRPARDLRVPRALERLPDVIAHDVEPEDAEQNADVHHVAGELAEPRNLHDQIVHPIEDEKSIKKNQADDVTHQALPVVGFELLQMPQNEQRDDQQREGNRSA